MTTLLNKFFSDLQVLNMRIALVTSPAFDTDSFQFVVYPANTGPCAVSLLVQRRRRWSNIETTHGQCPMLVVSTIACGTNRDISAVSDSGVTSSGHHHKKTSYLQTAYSRS